MQGSYDAKDVVIKVRTFDRMTGEVLSEKEVVGFADECLAISNNLLESLDFDKILRERGVGYIYGVVRKKDETDAEYEQRIIETKKGII